ncbi:hypothetical protein EWM64_g9343 [Hericium alpestre]|uniref:NAD(P)-binding protein n=1 Tax=Hericium alpestre TaxID=135208 RepID=A0A4Y9ZML0_9AGAM|nr:hypothetical protein EWM64_g9343 [Hericium alpestre]
MPDLTGRVVLVTGGSAGIGKETVAALLAHNATVYLAARSPAKAHAAIRELKERTGREAVFLELDLANLASVKRAAEEFLEKEKELHVLFNNAGVMFPPHNQLTKDGFDLQWGTNVVGHYALTKGLLPALLAAAQSSPDGKARVVTTSSMAAYLNTIHWSTFARGPGRDKLTKYALYEQSKHANVVFARELGRRYGDRGIVSTSVNPGNIVSELQRHMNPVLRWIAHKFIYPTPYGALNQLWAGTSPETADFNGKFIIPWTRVGECRRETNDPEIGRRLWAQLEEDTHV